MHKFSSSSSSSNFSLNIHKEITTTTTTTINRIKMIKTSPQKLKHQHLNKIKMITYALSA